MPLLTADFALLSYVTRHRGGCCGRRRGDGWLGSISISAWRCRASSALTALSRGLRLPFALSDLPLIERSFVLCFVLSSLEMTRVERLFPGSRFSDSEVDELFGRDMSRLSRARLDTFRPELESAESPSEWRAMVASISGGAAAFMRPVYAGGDVVAPGLSICNSRLRDWVHREVPRDLLVDPATRDNKVLVRQHIATRFHDLPYVSRKGSFRFDLRGGEHASMRCMRWQQASQQPGRDPLVDRNRHRLDNKYHASKFYPLAVVLPWITAQAKMHANFHDRTAPPSPAMQRCDPAGSGTPTRGIGCRSRCRRTMAGLISLRLNGQGGWIGFHR
jgi:hypothetical protein